MSHDHDGTPQPSSRHSSPSAVRFQTAIESYGLLQHISSPTHRAGHLLDVFITRTDIPVQDVDVQPPEMSEHSFITLTVDLQFHHGQPTNSIRRRQWCDFNYNKFCADLSLLSLLCDPPRGAIGLFIAITTLCRRLLTNMRRLLSTNYVPIQPHRGMILNVT